MTFGMFMSGLWHNRVLLSAATGWAAAQILKTIIHALLEDEWKLERLVGSGGMPSSHAATVCALVTAAAYNYGPNSFEFTISFLLAIIVLHDARGVRLETGKQAGTSQRKQNNTKRAIALVQLHGQAGNMLHLSPKDFLKAFIDQETNTENSGADNQ